MPNWDYRVTGYAGHHHPRAPFGAFLLATNHKGESSLVVEVQAWQARMKRGECSRVEIVYLIEPYGMDTITDPEKRYVRRRP